MGFFKPKDGKPKATISPKNEPILIEFIDVEYNWLDHLFPVNMLNYLTYVILITYVTFYHPGKPSAGYKQQVIRFHDSDKYLSNSELCVITLC